MIPPSNVLTCMPAPFTTNKNEVGKNTTTPAGACSYTYYTSSTDLTQTKTATTNALCGFNQDSSYYCPMLPGDLMPKTTPYNLSLRWQALMNATGARTGCSSMSSGFTFKQGCVSLWTYNWEIYKQFNIIFNLLSPYQSGAVVPAMDGSNLNF